MHAEVCSCTCTTVWYDTTCSAINYIVLTLGRYYNGHMPMLCVTDVDILKQILVKEFDAFMDRPVSYS